MAKPAKPTAGVIGLGIIGSRVVDRLRKAGYQTWIWNRSPRPEPNFLSSPREVAEAATQIQIFVSDGAALLSVIDAMLPALTPQHIVLNHATVSPDQTREAANLVASSHAKFLDAPFTGSRDAAEQGELTYYIGGDPAVLQAARPLLEASSRAILEIGDIGQASVVKIATNLVSAAMVEALAEAHSLLDKSGVELRKFSEALVHNVSHSQLAEAKIPCMIAGDFEPRFSLKHMFKDVQLALEIAGKNNIELPSAAAFAGAAMAGMQQGWGDSDFAVISRFYGFPGQGHLLPETPATPALRGAAGHSREATSAKAGGWGLFRKK